MYKPPPPDDEHHASPQINNSLQRRRPQAAPKRPPTTYHPDELPGVPIKRRASLRLDQQQPETRPLESDSQRPKTKLSANTDRPIPAHRQKAAKPSAHVKQRAPIENEDIDDDVDERRYVQSTRNYGHPARATSASLKQPAPIFEPPLKGHRPKRTRTRHVHAHRPFLVRLEQLRYNQAAVIIATLALALLVLIPITIGASRSYTATSSGTISTSNGQPPANIQQAPLDPHELIIAPQDTDHPPPPVYATSAYLLDADSGATLYAHNPFVHLPMLSTTKLMTATLAIERGDMNQKITISDAMMQQINHLSADSALFHLKKDETYTLGDLVNGLLFVSGNDAALVIADVIGGNVPNFVAAMNARARDLGLYDTHFMNPHGLLQSGQYSSAHDLALLGRYSMSLPLLHQISGGTFYHIPKGGNHPDRLILNENQFLWWYPGVDGGKTGYDNSSDFIQVISCTRNHHHLIGVVMHTNNWWTDTRDLMNWGFNSFSWISPYDVDFQKPIPYDNLWNYFVDDKKENTIPTADSGRYYIYTGFSVSGPILSYFDSAGGLKQFGYPTKILEVSGTSIIRQRFEHGTIQCNLATNQCQRA